MNSSPGTVASPRGRSGGPATRSKRPLLAMITRSVVSRSTGLAGERNEPQAHDPLAPRCFCHTTSPRSSKRRSSCRIDVTSAARLRYGRRPRLATLTAIRPPGSSVRTRLGEDVAQHREVLDVVGRHVALTERRLVLLAGEVRRRRDHECHRRVGHLVHVAGVADVDHVEFARRAERVVVADLGRLEAGVEVGGVVRLAASDTERGGRRSHCVRLRPAPNIGGLTWASARSMRSTGRVAHVRMRQDPEPLGHDRVEHRSAISPAGIPVSTPVRNIPPIIELSDRPAPSRPAPSPARSVLTKPGHSTLTRTGDPRGHELEIQPLAQRDDARTWSRCTARHQAAR